MVNQLHGKNMLGLLPSSLIVFSEKYLCGRDDQLLKLDFKALNIMIILPLKK